EVRQGTATLQLPVEVPAAGEKIYNVRLAPPVGSVQTRLRLFATGAEVPAATASVQLRAPQDQTVVAVMASAEVLATVDDATVGVTGGEIVTAEVDGTVLERGPYPARYLILDPASPLPPATREWVRSGGRVIASADELAQLDLELGEPTGDGEGIFYRVGSGLVIGATGLRSLDSADWSHLITPTALDLAPRDIWQSPDMQLMQAATNAGDQRIPAIPWLFAAVIGYAVVVGPLNFLVLRKLGRRELAWVTVPVLSIVAVGGFWLLGRQRLETTLVNHATVIMTTPAGAPARTAVAVAAGTGGDKSIAVPPEWLSYPGSISPELAGGFPIIPAVATTDGDGGFRFRLEQLGVAGVQAAWEAASIGAPDVDASREGARLVVDVRNDTDLEYWAWGIVSRGRATVSPEALSPGRSGQAAVVPGQSGMNEFGTVGDAVIQARQLWNDPFIWNKLSPLGYTATALLDERDSYFFGFTDQLTIEVELDGRPTLVSGTALLVIPIDAATSQGQTGGITGHLLDTGDATWIDFGPGYLSVSSDEMTVGWDLNDPPRGDPNLQVSNVFGELPERLDAYNWETGAYDEVERGDTLDMDLYRSARGEVMVRARAFVEDNPDRFVEVPMTPYAFTLEWGS
ncbi:MAG TPA: hypothetical protein VLA54_14410, partial [Acidimicrobiia bacterium]|nr:hypothetical protein [Acidimicrobiia bacterium]